MSTKVQNDNSNKIELKISDYVKGIKSGDRKSLAQAITLVESEKKEHQLKAQELLTDIFTNEIKSLRIGITGIPGAGKSTFIEKLGTNLTSSGHKVAVLTIDPSSSITGGSILGDKTRMLQLSKNSNAFIRPSPTSGTLGGVNKKTRETILLCEAAGYDIILIETVGIGQSEISISEMVDFCLLLLISGGGDELQGIKKGVLELADMVAINKSDGDNIESAKISAIEYKNALRIFKPKDTKDTWQTPVLTISSLKNIGLEELWSQINERLKGLKISGKLKDNRLLQQKKWMWEIVENRLLKNIRSRLEINNFRITMEDSIATGDITPVMAAEKIYQKINLKE